MTVPEIDTPLLDEIEGESKELDDIKGDEEIDTMAVTDHDAALLDNGEGE